MGIQPDAIVICGCTTFGRELYGVLEAAGETRKGGVVAFDLIPARVEAARASGKNAFYGDGSLPAVLFATGIIRPKAVVIAHRSEKMQLDAIPRIRSGLPGDTVIYA